MWASAKNVYQAEKSCKTVLAPALATMKHQGLVLSNSFSCLLLPRPTLLNLN